MSGTKTLVTTRAQREAVYRLFARYHADALNARFARWPALAERYFPSLAWYGAYRQYRERFKFTGYGSDWYLFGQPFDQGAGQLFVGIEPDGYTHS